MTLTLNPLHDADFYKVGHVFQYPENTQMVYSNLTPRFSQHYKGTEFWDGKAVFFGLQGWIQWYLQGVWEEEFFSKPKEEVLKTYQRRVDNSLGKGVSVDHIAALHDLGYLPIEIRALPEGASVKMGVPVLTIHNTLEEFYWLTNYLETVMSNSLWKSIVNATIAKEYRSILTHFFTETGCPIEMVEVFGHDFSARGMSCPFDAKINGAAHLTSFIGTDTISAIDYVEQYYSANSDLEPVGVSVPATEHSVMCMGGQETEIETFRRLIKDVYPTGIVSIVSDTWDFWRVITEFAKQLSDDILSRGDNELGMSKVVFRPDSGDPVKILTGYTWAVAEDDDSALEVAWQYYWDYDSPPEVMKIRDKYFEIVTTYDLEGHCFDFSLGNEISEAEVKGAVECLWDIFGGTITHTGHKVLNSKVGLIYGDSITTERAVQILQRLADKGFAACNVVLGIGSYTYQYNTRDTLGMAMKATAGRANDAFVKLKKDPKTDDGKKKSASGMLDVYLGEDGDYYLQEVEYSSLSSELSPVFYNGDILRLQSLRDIKNKVARSI